MSEIFEVTAKSSHKDELRKRLGELMEEGLIHDFGLKEKTPEDEIVGVPDE